MKNAGRNLQIVMILILGFVIIFMASGVYAEKIEITEEEVVESQKDWGAALVNLGRTYSDGQNYRQEAENLVDRLYAYQTDQVLFKPTKAADVKFRTTKEGAISYFVGHDKNFPEDKGFALEPWTNVQFKNEAIYINGNIAMAMGTYFFTPQKGEVAEVEYTFGYVKNDDGKLKIVLHHSSLPYAKK